MSQLLLNFIYKDNLLNMFHEKGKPLITLKRKTNRNGNFYYYGIQDSIFWYLFSSNQFWYGTTEKTTSGELMIKNNLNDKLVKFGTWKKQSNGTIIIYCQINGGKYGLLGKYHKKSIDLYWADTNVEVLKLVIENNYFLDIEN